MVYIAQWFILQDTFLSIKILSLSSKVVSNKEQVIMGPILYIFKENIKMTQHFLISAVWAGTVFTHVHGCSQLVCARSLANWSPSSTIIFLEKTEKLGQKDRACLNPKDYYGQTRNSKKKSEKKTNAIVLPVNRQCVTCFRTPLWPHYPFIFIHIWIKQGLMTKYFMPYQSANFQKANFHRASR